MKILHKRLHTKLLPVWNWFRLAVSGSVEISVALELFFDSGDVVAHGDLHKNLFCLKTNMWRTIRWASWC